MLVPGSERKSWKLSKVGAIVFFINKINGLLIYRCCLRRSACIDFNTQWLAWGAVRWQSQWRRGLAGLCRFQYDVFNSIQSAAVSSPLWLRVCPVPRRYWRWRYSLLLWRAIEMVHRPASKRLCRGLFTLLADRANTSFGRLSHSCRLGSVVAHTKIPLFRRAA